MQCKKDWIDFTNFLPRRGAFPPFPQTNTVYSFSFSLIPRFLLTFLISKPLHYPFSCLLASSDFRLQRRFFLRPLCCRSPLELTGCPSLAFPRSASLRHNNTHSCIQYVAQQCPRRHILSSQQSNKRPIVHTSFSLRFDTRESITAERLDILDSISISRFHRTFVFSHFLNSTFRVSDGWTQQENPRGPAAQQRDPLWHFFESGFTTDFEWVTLLVQFKRFDWLIVARFPSRHFSRLNEWLTFIPSQKGPGNNFVSLHCRRRSACCRKALFLALCSDHKHSLLLIPFLNAITFFYSAAQKRFTLQ